MTGLYLYCIREKSKTKIKLPRIDRKSKFFSIAVNDLEGIVSKINTKKFTSKEILKKAKEDLNWVIKEAQTHESVIEEAMKGGTVIPMKFGMVFESQQSFEKMFKKNFKKFKKILRNLKNKEEWGLKIYLNKKKFEHQLKTKNSSLKAQFKKAKGLPRGKDYFQELENQKLLERVMETEIRKMKQRFFKHLKPYILKTKNSKILSKELAGKNEPMISNNVFLIKKEMKKTLKEKIKELQKLNSTFRFHLTGPWPPYNFLNSRS
jgi:hypothetical protein